MNLIYIHIGKVLPEYIYDSIYQSLLTSPNSKIYVLSDHVTTIRKCLTGFTIDSSNVECIPLSILQTSDKISRYTKYTKQFPQDTVTFREGFWISTTSRFFYIEEFMRLFELESAFHIENDVMLYEDLYSIQSKLKNITITMVQDNAKEARVVPSILYIPTLYTLSKMNSFILNKIENSNQFINDMSLLGSYPDKECFPYTFESESNLIFDGAAIGQFLGGVDPNNLPGDNKFKAIQNPSKGFINETCDFKITNNISFFRRPVVLDKSRIDLFYGLKENEQTRCLKQVANLHIHSKQLYQFSSIFNVKFEDIISGDRVLTLVDFIISTPSIYAYHEKLDRFVDTSKVILIQNFQKVNTAAINGFFDNFVTTKKSKVIKLFIYTHILEDFIKFVYHKLSKKYLYVVYLHNSDHEFGNSDLYNRFVSDKNIKHIFAQNVNTNTNKDKVTLLPIGLANSMFKHGDMISLYNVMSKTYKFKKTSDIYININPKTFAYRREILKGLQTANIDSPKPFEEYLFELSQHRFCLCLRGNGVDTHRFWESISLNVIPVIINNKHTNMKNFVLHLKKLGVPFYEITCDNTDDIIDKYFKSNFFNERLYNKVKSEFDLSGGIQCLHQLKLSYYN